MSLIGSVAAALTLGARRQGVVLSILVLPLYIPPLVFGAGAVDASAAGIGGRAHLLILAALSLAALAALPLGERCGVASGAGLRFGSTMPSVARNSAARSRPGSAMINWLANPARFTRCRAAALPWCGWSAAVVTTAGLFWSLVWSPPDYQQGESVRIMYRGRLHRRRPRSRRLASVAGGRPSAEYR